MKTIQTIIIIFLFLSKISAQPIANELVWAKEFKNFGLSSLLIETDSDDNIYAAGVYLGCSSCYIEWEGDTIINQGSDSYDIFVAKISSNGELLWSLFIGGEDSESLSGFRLDSNNDIVVYITNYETFTFSSTIIENGHNLLKFDEDGQFLWNSNVQGARHNSNSAQLSGLSEQLSISCNDDIVIGGSIRKYSDINTVIDTIFFYEDTFYVYLQLFDTLEIDNQSFTIDTNNIFIAKFEPDGNLLWAKTFEHNGRLALSSLDATKNQEINVLGYFQNEDWILEGKVLPADTADLMNKRNVYILKLDETGELIWGNKYFDDVSTVNISSDHLGNIIATGHFQPNTYFEQDTISVTGAADDILIFKVDSLGNYIWGTNAGDQTSNNNCYLLTNNDNEIYLSGDLGSHLGSIMYKYTTSGDLIWELDPSESSNRNGGDIAFDNSGNLIHTGVHTGNFIIGNDTLGNASSQWHEYILKFNNQTDPDFIEDCGETTSLNNITQEISNLKVFPNPANDKLFINYELIQVGDIDIRLFSIEGKLVAEKKKFNTKKGSDNFDIEDLPLGSYFLKLTSNGITKSKLIIKI